MIRRSVSGAMLALTVWAEHAARSSFTFNGLTVSGVRVGKETKTTQVDVPAPPGDNLDTILDETTFKINVQYATVFNKVTKQDYFYVINTLEMPPPPAAFPKFSVLLFTEIITSGDDPIAFASVTPDFETVTATTPFTSETNLNRQLWMLN